VKAARGGPVPQVDIVKWIDGSEVAQEYILDWGETSKRTASVMIDDTWLHHHTRYSEFLDLADGCIAHDSRLVDRYTRSGDMETPEQFIARSDRIASFLCVSPDDMGDFIRRLRRHTIDMYREAKRIATIKEDEDEDEDEDGEEYADEEPEPYNREAFVSLSFRHFVKVIRELTLHVVDHRMRGRGGLQFYPGPNPIWILGTPIR
jgi:hypothetical protein